MEPGRLQLPRLPIPPLRDTLDRYLNSIEPLLLEDEARGGQPLNEAMWKRAKWADEFERGVGKACQERLQGVFALCTVPAAVYSHLLTHRTGQKVAI